MSSNSENTINNKRIAKNTALLYVRMLFLMAVGLFTSRVILASLGVVDYGISNVVGGVVAMFGFLNAAMTTSTQRYLTYELGRGETGRLRLTFMTSVYIHIIIAATVVLLAETIGLWFLKNKIVIPSGRETAAMYCYQFAILSTVVSILNYPFNAAIVAHERMDAFAYISILDVMLKLGVAYTIYAVNLDKLIVYSILMLLVQIVMTSIYAIYCKRHFEANYDASKNYTYQIGADNEVNVTSAEFKVSVTINHTSTSNGTTSSKTIKIKSDNGNYTSFNVTVTLTTRTEGFIFQTKYYTYTYSKSTPQQTIVTGGTPAKNTFKYTEIMNGDWCEKYYQEGTDDLGKWRIPNEKELYFIPMYCGEEITGNLAGYKPSGAQTETGTMRYAAKTKYNRNLIHDPSNPGNTFMIYYLQKDGSSGTPIVTTGHGQSGADFTIRCVRDAPQGTRSYDSSYSSGGTGFGL